MGDSMTTQRVLCALFSLASLLGLIFFVNSLGSSDEDRTVGAHTFSAMSLYAEATGDTNDTDLEGIVKYVISDMGGIFGYREIRQYNGVDRLDIVLLYHPRYDTEERIEYNRKVARMLPERLSEVKRQDFFASGDSADVSSCVCSWDQTYILQILYNRRHAMQRVSVVAHEYYHVVQTHFCRSTHTEKFDLVMWLSEGPATVFEHLYVLYYFRNDSRHENFLFRQDYGAIRQVHDMIKSTAFEYDQDMNGYEGAQNNYVASVTATLYLIRRLRDTGIPDPLSHVLIDFLEDGRCQRAASGDRDAGFKQAFSVWEGYGAFFSDLNEFLRAENDTAKIIEVLQPSWGDVMSLFNHTSLCSDLDPLSRNGECDASQTETDCTDCGPTPRPMEWPVLLSPEHD